MSDQYDDGFYYGQQDRQVKIDKVLYLIEDFKMIRFTNQTEVIQKYIEG